MPTTEGGSAADGSVGGAEPVTVMFKLLEAILRAAGRPFDSADAKLTVASVAEAFVGLSLQDTWSIWFARLGNTYGLRTTTFRAHLGQALSLARRGVPLALRLPARGDISRFAVICGGAAGRLSLEIIPSRSAPETWDPRRIRGEFPASPGDPVVDFVLVEPHEPAAELPAGDHDSDGHDHAAHVPPLRRLLHLLRPERRDIAIIIAFSIGVGLLTLATPVAVQMLVNFIAFGGLLQPLALLSILLFIGLGFGAAMRALQTFVVEIIQRRVFVRVFSDLAFRLPRVRVDAFDRRHGPELVNRFFDVLTVQKVSASLLLDGVAVLLQAAIGLLVLAFYHPLLLAFDVVLLLAMAFVVFALGRGAVRTAIRESVAKYAAAGWLEEMARHPAAFKTSGGPDLAADRSEQLAHTYLAERANHFRIVFRQTLGSLALNVLASTFLLGLGGFLVIQGQLTLGQLIAAELIVAAIVASNAKLAKHLENFYDLMAAVDKLGHLMDLPLERGAGAALLEPLPVHELDSRGARLSLEDVSFTYDGHRPAVGPLSLCVSTGERVAILGANGSGKSTVVDLIMAMREPSRGRIQVDGVDLRNLRLDDLRSVVATARGIELFQGSLSSNVRLGRPSLTSASIRKALDDVGLLEEVMSLPGGMEAELFTGGAPLSDGQARRLMLARAIAGRPRLLIVDELLDSLGTVARDRALRCLLDPEAAWTLLVVTHSPEIAARCQRIITLGAPGNGHPTAARMAH